MIFKTSLRAQILVIIAIGLVGIANCGTYRVAADEKCKDVDIVSWVMTDAERAQKRLDNDTPVTISSDDISKLIKDKEYGAAIKSVLAYFILILILLFFTFVSFIIYFFFCCCCKRYSKASETKAKVSWMIAMLFFIVFTVFFILMIIFLSKTDKQYKDIQCAISSISADLLDGTSAKSVRKFMGFLTLNQQFTSLKTEIATINTVQSDFSAISSRNVNDKAQSAYDALPIFITKYKDSTTRNGSGTAAKPSSISSLTTHVSDAIKAEFATYISVGTALNDVGEQGEKFAVSGQTSNIQVALQEIIDYITTLITPLESQLSSVDDGMNTGAKFVPTGTYIALAIGIVIFLLSALFMIVLFCQYSKHRCMSGTCLIKTGMIVLGFLAVLLTIIAVVILVASVGVSSLCGILADLLDATDINVVLAKYDITFSDSTVSDAFNKCVPANGSGDITSLVGGTGTSAQYMDYIQDFLDGLLIFQTQISVINEGALDSTTVVAQTTIWTSIQTGLTIDQSDVSSALSNLNSIIKCGNVSFQINSQSCGSSDTGCQGIATTASFSPPTCSSDSATASALFTNLRNYYTDENTLMTNMISDLGSTGSDTANNRFRTTKQAIRDSITNYNNISAKLSGTIAATAAFDDGFKNLSDCRILRTEIENIESVFCFNVNKPLYLFFVFTALAAFCLFMLNWCICTTLRCIADESKGKFKNADKHNHGEPYFNDDEKVPL